MISYKFYIYTQKLFLLHLASLIYLGVFSPVPEWLSCFKTPAGPSATPPEFLELKMPKVLLGVTGSVAAIKVPELVEKLQAVSSIQVKY